MTCRHQKPGSTVEVVRSVDALRGRISQWKQQGKRIALVPTMGNLHEGHLSLVKAANRQASCTIVSIFVNPLQFSPDDDFATYPRTLTEDIHQLTADSQSDCHADLVFAPEVDEMYPAGEQQSAYIDVPALSSRLEGRFRPGFFRGVATVVAKLFNMVQPDIAFFGEKDFQQLLIIRQMVADLAIPVEIQAVATVREADGLAMSSRNNYLSTQQREKSALLYRTMCSLRDRILQGDAFAPAEIQLGQQLTGQGFIVDYLSVRESRTLQQPKSDDNALIILVAARLGKTRLIDNLLFIRDPDR